VYHQNIPLQKNNKQRQNTTKTPAAMISMYVFVGLGDNEKMAHQ
jgi:hypothetical protein